MWNIHKESRNTKHWWLSWFRYETFINFFKLGFSTRGERDTIFLCWLFHLTRQCAPHPLDHNWTCLAQVRKINSLRLSSNLNSLLLFKITKNPSASLPGMTSFTSPVSFSIWGFYCDICDCYILPARTWTPALMSALTHALSWKVLSRTKPKYNIYKMEKIY